MALPDDASVAPASDGRIPGPRGLATRNRLIECTAAIVATTPYSDLRVTDVARAAGTSPATFYQYFVDIDAALLVLATQTTEVGAQLAAFIQNRRWRGKAGYTTARELVDGFLDFWQAHLPVLRVVDLLTEEGDARFRQARVKMLNGITTALADAIGSAKPDGQVPAIAPMATASALVSMLAHVAAHREGMEHWRIEVPQLQEAMARLIYWGVNSPRVPTA
ncbi:MAG TPA: TetR family transcriptional regulator [Frankiaceae bacterium]|jgi:AcrR family transcriptional regulator|nr:TetR family transcriptional regulator [Frankiaceae bacterium]